jgi:hypothetical protein
MDTTRVSIDCRNFPSDTNCSLKLSGTSAEILPIATRHAVEAHGHADTPELTEMLRGALQPAND